MPSQGLLQRYVVIDARYIHNNMRLKRQNEWRDDTSNWSKKFVARRQRHIALYRGVIFDNVSCCLQTANSWPRNFGIVCRLLEMLKSPADDAGGTAFFGVSAR
jgi:hypothetical protein